jgi:hypothetical protein
VAFAGQRKYLARGQVATNGKPSAANHNPAICRIAICHFSFQPHLAAMSAMKSNPNAAPPKLKPSKLGGLNHLERLLGLRQDAVLSRDAVFISLDLEVTSDRQRLHLSSESPVIKQLAFAKLDTRDIHSLSILSDLKSLISVSMFEQWTFPNSRIKERPCVFAQTQYFTQNELSTIIIQSLVIKDKSKPPKTHHMRDIVLVGHSIREDLKILRLLEIDISKITSILTIIDTHTISRFIFPPYHPTLIPEPNQKFSLAGVFAELGCHPNPSNFHNAGNDAVYTLYTMLLLAIRRGESRLAELSGNESRSLEVLSYVVSEAIKKGLSSESFDK